MHNKVWVRKWYVGDFRIMLMIVRIAEKVGQTCGRGKSGELLISVVAARLHLNVTLEHAIIAFVVNDLDAHIGTSEPISEPTTRDS